MEESVADLIKNNMTVNTKMFDDSVDDVVMNLDQIINLINNVGADPIGTITLMTKIVVAFKQLAASCQADRDKSLSWRESVRSTYYKQYSSKDSDVNPFGKTSKLTQDFINAAVVNEKLYQEADATYQRLKYLTNVAYNIKDVLDAQLQLMHAFAKQPELLPASGKAVENEEIQEQLAKFKQSLGQQA